MPTVKLKLQQAERPPFLMEVDPSLDLEDEIQD